MKTKILDCLSDVNASGSFACADSLNCPAPGLTISGLGTIGLPLSLRDAEAIIKVAHKSAFGKGTKTIIDEKVRKCLELDPTQFELQNPAWAREIPKLAARVAQELGVASNVSAHLYKLLLYQEGAFFLPHQE